MTANTEPQGARPDFSKFSMQDLLCIYDACERSIDAIVSIINQPRCEEHLYGFLERRMSTPLSRLQEAVFDEASARKPATRKDAELRAVILVRDHIETRDFALAQVALANAIAFDEDGEAA